MGLPLFSDNQFQGTGFCVKGSMGLGVTVGTLFASFCGSVDCKAYPCLTTQNTLITCSLRPWRIWIPSFLLFRLKKRHPKCECTIVNADR